MLHSDFQKVLRVPMMVNFCLVKPDYSAPLSLQVAESKVAVTREPERGRSK